MELWIIDFGPQLRYDGNGDGKHFRRDRGPDPSRRGRRPARVGGVVRALSRPAAADGQAAPRPPAPGTLRSFGRAPGGLPGCGETGAGVPGRPRDARVPLDPLD